MKYAEFKNAVLDKPLILSRDILRFKTGRQNILNQLRRWRKRGLLVRIKRGVYILNKNDRRINPSLKFLANQIYSPSYVSMEYALNFYGLIPESVHTVTSVSTRKTARFKNASGDFVYQHIQPSAYRGYKSLKDEAGLGFLIAEPEKAVVDFLYLNKSGIKAEDKSVFRESFRFQNTESLRRKKIMESAALFGNNALTGICRRFCDFIREERTK